MRLILDWLTDIIHNWHDVATPLLVFCYFFSNICCVLYVFGIKAQAMGFVD